MRRRLGHRGGTVHAIVWTLISGEPTPIFDAFSYLGFLAARTERLRLGTHVFNIGLRHPFTSARGAQTVDLLSNGRFDFGIGASWLEEE